MRKRLFSAIAAVLASSGLADAQVYYPPYPSPYPPAYVAPGGYVPGYPPAMAYPVPAYPGPAYPVMPAPGAPVGRATVSDAAPPVIHGWPPPAGVVPGVPVGPSAGSAATAGSPRLPASTEAALVPGAAVGSVPVTPVHRPRAEKACTDCAAPATAAGGLPLTCEVTPLGQPVVPFELEREPRGYCGYAKGEFLYWFVKHAQSPDLLRLASVRGVDVLTAESVDANEREGSRTTLGFWVDRTHKVALEGTFFWFGDRHPRFIAGTPTIERPFFDVVAGAESVLTVAAPGVATGAAQLRGGSRFYGAEANLRHELCCFKCGHLDILGGFRYLQFAEGIEVTTSSVPAGGGFLLTSDRFGAENNFFGGQLGLEAEFNWGRLSINPYGKVAVGQIYQTVTINGNRVLPDANGVPASVLGGFLALPTNIGNYGHNTISYVPEVGINFGYKVCENVRLIVGYSGLLVSNVARPGDQINRNLNLTQLPGVGGFGAIQPPLSPIFTSIQDKTFWAQGANVGIEFRW